MIKIKDKVIANKHQPYIIAEMACAHDGDFDKAIKLVDSAVNAGADAVQLQFFISEETIVTAIMAGKNTEARYRFSNLKVVTIKNIKNRSAPI